MSGTVSEPDQQQQPQSQPQMQPMMMGPPMMGPGPMMAMGPCPMCGNGAPPMIVYELNTTGYIIIVVFLIFGFCITGAIIACFICGDKQQPDSCHDPKGKCTACGAHRIG